MTAPLSKQTLKIQNKFIHFNNINV